MLFYCCVPNTPQGTSTNNVFLDMVVLPTWSLPCGEPQPQT